MAKIINGTKKADNLTVNESNVTLNAGKGNVVIGDYRIILLHILTVPK